MFFKDARNRFFQLIFGTNVNMFPLFISKITEAHVIKGITDDKIRIFLFKVVQVIACVFN